MPAKRARCTHCQGDWAYNETRLKMHIIDPQKGCPKVPDQIRQRVRDESMDGRTGGSLSYSGPRLKLDPIKANQPSVSSAGASRNGGAGGAGGAGRPAAASKGPGPSRAPNGPTPASGSSARPGQAVPPSHPQVRAPSKSGTEAHPSNFRQRSDVERTPMQGRTATPSHSTRRQPAQVLSVQPVRGQVQHALRVNIEFSQTELLRAMWIATELLKGQFGQHVTQLSLSPLQVDGAFTIRINDKAVWNRLPGHSPPDYDMIIRPLLSAQLDPSL